MERVTKNVLALTFAYNAGWDAALERAAAVAQQFDTSADSQHIGATIARSIRALKGRE